MLYIFSFSKENSSVAVKTAVKGSQSQLRETALLILVRSVGRIKSAMQNRGRMVVIFFVFESKMLHNEGFKY